MRLPASIHSPRLCREVCREVCRQPALHADPAQLGLLTGFSGSGVWPLLLEERTRLQEVFCTLVSFSSVGAESRGFDANTLQAACRTTVVCSRAESGRLLVASGLVL